MSPTTSSHSTPALSPHPSTDNTSTSRAAGSQPHPISASSPPTPTQPGFSNAPAPPQVPKAPRLSLPNTKPLPSVALPPSTPLVTQPATGVPIMSAVMSPGQTPEPPRVSMTSREWVIPPRPKPGRKPATDTPPTKRKAQNRAAQRAFRERRAARVGELEEQLDHQQASHDKENTVLKDRVHELELQVQSFRSRCTLLESMLERERQDRMNAEHRAESYQRQRDARRTHSEDSRTNHAQPGRQPQQQIPISQIVSSPDAEDVSSVHLTCGNCGPRGPCVCAGEPLTNAKTGCGKCSVGSSCQCFEQTSPYVEGSSLKRASSPTGSFSEAKRRNILDMDVAFAPGEPMSARDSCGFCKDGTYCVCAEAEAMATPAMTPSDITAPAISNAIQTPPASEPDVVLPGPTIMEMTADGAVKLPRRTQQPHPKPGQAGASSSCGANGPGSCAQCQADPKSGLFCRLMAAKYDREREQGGKKAGGCCGGKGGKGCCKTPQQAPNAIPASEQREKITLPSLPSLGLTPAQAYQTLSSHRNFDKASDDIASWLPMLRTTPVTGGPHRPPAGRMNMEIEAASIMSVLKDFDVRFCRDA